VTQAPSVPRDEAAFVAINKLPQELQSYAREWWHYLQTGGKQMSWLILRLATIKRKASGLLWLQLSNGLPFGIPCQIPRNSLIQSWYRERNTPAFQPVPTCAAWQLSGY
jgi:hypothetical protein